MVLPLVQDWMTRDIITVTSQATLPQARHLMEENGIRHLPVVDDGRLVGIVTWGDIREASASDATALSVYELRYLLDALTVGYIMTPHPITVTPHTTVARAAQILLERKIGCLPVVRHGKLVGIITESDIFRLVVLGQVA
jgi:acetoin utilization protein AcuB